MSDTPNVSIVDLSDTDLTLADKYDDVRGRTVMDREGNEVGDVDGLLIDEDERRVRFLRVGSGGFLGIGEKKRLLPVDVIARVDDKVHIDRTREDVAGSPEYDPELTEEETLPYGDFYGYYGVAPFWYPGYAYPLYPRR